MTVPVPIIQSILRVGLFTSALFLLLLSGCSKSAPPMTVLPAAMPANWRATIAVRGTTEMPGTRPRVLVSILGNSANPSLDVVTRTSPDGCEEDGIFSLSNEQCRELYDLVRESVSSHRLSLASGDVAEDGDSLLIKVRVASRSVELGYHHNSVASAEVSALLKAFNRILKDSFELRWPGMAGK